MNVPSNLPAVRLKRLEILVIENDPASARITREAFKEAGFSEGIHNVRDGDEAIAFLRREAGFAQHAHPDLIFLDLHLPKRSGLEVLRELKSNPDLQMTPVVVVSGSSDPEEVRQAYELHASCYVRKPDNLDDFLSFVRCCYEFWGSQVVFPPSLERESSAETAFH